MPSVLREHRELVLSPRSVLFEDALGAAAEPLGAPKARVIVDPDLGLGDFVRGAWHVVEPENEFVSGFHIDAIVEHLEAVSAGQIQNLVINIPPRHMKSLLVSVFWFAWSWTRDPGMRWLYSSYAQSLSVRDSLKSRRLVTSPWYQHRWGHLFRMTGDQNEKIRFENDRSGYRIASSVEGGNTGEGGDIIVADDPHNIKEIESVLTRESVLSWWDNVMTSRSGRRALPRKVIIMQRSHERDLSGHVLQHGGYVHLRLPQEYEPKVMVKVNAAPDPLGDPDWRTHPGELLWPERFGPEEVASIKTGGISSYHLAGQYQQRPAPAEGGIFKREHWRFWQPKGQDYGPVMITLADGRRVEIMPVVLPDQFDETLQSWDMSFKAKRTSDFVAGHVWSRRMANSFMRDRRNERLNFPDTVKAVEDMTEAWPMAGRKLIEDAANGPAVIQTLQGKIPGVIGLRADGDKVARAQAVTYLHEGHNLFLPHPVLCPWVWDVIEQFAAFPNGANDDDVDAGVQANRHLFRGIGSDAPFATVKARP